MQESERDVIRGNIESANQNRAPIFTIGGYAVLELLGSGAFGSVYKVHTLTPHTPSQVLAPTGPQAPLRRVSGAEGDPLHSPLTGQDTGRTKQGSRETDDRGQHGTRATSP